METDVSQDIFLRILIKACTTSIETTRFPEYKLFYQQIIVFPDSS